ncbi:hypothetical protein QL285_098704 [Trifolium repens]|nr:hypothetical protein QL285_098704 [Trifolium repens]
MVKRARGRPKRTAPSTPNNHPVSDIAIETAIEEDDEQPSDNPKNGMPTVPPPVEMPESATLADSERKLWVDVLTENRNPTRGMALKYVAPTVVNGEIEVAIDEADTASEVQFWQNSLILYVLGAELSMHLVKNFMLKTWNHIQLPDMYFHDDGYFILRFQSPGDMDSILKNGPYTIRGMPLILKAWKPGFDMKKDMLRTLPIWVKLPKLPLDLWGNGLDKIGSALGKPLMTDECTANKLRVSYARILVEVDITQKLIEEIPIKTQGGQIKQLVEYEWKPMFCDKCQKVGHNCAVPGKKKVWQPKPKHPQAAPKPAEPASVTTLIKEASNDTTEEEEGVWTIPLKDARTKGKTVEIIGSSGVPCANVIEAIWILRDPSAPFDRGP